MLEQIFNYLIHSIVQTLSFMYPLESKVRDLSYGRRDVPLNDNEQSLESEGLVYSETYLDTDLGKVYFRTLWNKAKFEGDDKVVCDVIKVHGYGTYGGRFSKPHQFLENGVRLHVVDLPSHGRSDGLHGYVPNIKGIGSALEKVKLEVRRQFIPKKLFLMGSSLGGLISLHTVIENGGYDGLIAVSPCIKVHSYISPPRIAVLIGYLFNRFLPQLPVLPCKPKPHSKSYQSDLLFFQDPLTYTGPVRLGTILMFDFSPQMVLDQLHRLDVPVLVQQGDADWMVDPNAAQLILDRINSKDKSLKMYKGGEHDLHNDFTGNLVINDSLQWILNRCKSIDQLV